VARFIQTRIWIKNMGRKHHDLDWDARKRGRARGNTRHGFHFLLNGGAALPVLIRKQLAFQKIQVWIETL
jgi:hypothetical protein